MENNGRYAAFISYTHSDAAWARWLHRSLETYSVPKALRGKSAPIGVLDRRIGKVFLDEAELGSSSDIDVSIQEALAQSSSLIVICSPAAANSPRVSEEIRLFQDAYGRDRIFCLIVDGRPSVAKRGLTNELECFPELLLQGSEPLAADARGDRSKRRDARDRLLAGLMDVGFDELRQRELTRRNRRLLTVSVVSSTITVGAVALSIFAFSARQEATLQRDIAELETRKSDKVLEFVLESFQSADPYESNGLEITAEEILERSLQRVDADLVEEPEIQRKMRDSMAKIYYRLGEYRISESLLRSNLAQIDPTDLPAEYYEGSGHLAITLIELGEYEEAEELLRGQLEYDRQWSGSVLQIGGDLNDLGRLLKDQGNMEEAEQLLREAVEILEPTDEGSETLMIAYNNLAIVLMQTSQFGEARIFYDKTIKLRTETFGPDHPYVARAENNLGVLLYSLDDIEEARVYLEKGLRKRRAAFGDEHAEVAESTYNVAQIYMELSQFDAALESFNRALELDAASLGAEHVSVAYDLLGIGRTHAAADDWPAAGPFIDKALSIAEPKLNSTHQLMRGIRSLKAAYEYRLGRFEAAVLTSAKLRSTHDPDNEAIPPSVLLAEGINLLSVHAQGGSIDKSELQELISALERSDRRVETSILRVLQDACTELGCGAPD